MVDRREEIRRLLRLTPKQMLRKAKGRLKIYKDLDALHRALAEMMADEIERNNRKGRHTNLILPVGPTGQYPILAEIVNTRRISMKKCNLFFMDENCDPDGKCLPPTHPLSFRREAHELLFRRLDKRLAPPSSRVIFPSHDNIHTLADKIKRAGGIDTCYGGIGIHGHLAFNEPEPGVSKLGPRLVYLNDFTVTINAIRDEVGGNLEGFPRKAVTLGMREILSAKRIVLGCRNGIPLDWANTVLRLALFGEPGDDYPVTHIRGKNYLILTDEDTARRPKNIL